MARPAPSRLREPIPRGRSSKAYRCTTSSKEDHGSFRARLGKSCPAFLRLLSRKQKMRGGVSSQGKFVSLGPAGSIIEVEENGDGKQISTSWHHDAQAS